jgi:MFS family permease
MFLFGFATMMQGVVKNYSGLLACRFFLGVFETGMFPGGMSYFSSYWSLEHHASSMQTSYDSWLVGS